MDGLDLNAIELLNLLELKRFIELLNRKKIIKIKKSYELKSDRFFLKHFQEKARTLNWCFKKWLKITLKINFIKGKKLETIVSD